MFQLKYLYIGKFLKVFVALSGVLEDFMKDVYDSRF